MTELPELPYDYDALEPHIDEKTMHVHHEKHHAGYVKKYNAAVKGTAYEMLDVDEVLAQLDALPTDIKNAVRNNGGGVSNHNKFWEWMTPKSSQPKGELLDAIQNAFGSLDGFKDEFKAAALGRFGSGWAWLVDDNGLKIMTTANQDTPISQGLKPLLGLDVWEHSYYLQHQNKRDAYIDSWWNVVNWDKVEELFSLVN